MAAPSDAPRPVAVVAGASTFPAQPNLQDSAAFAASAAAFGHYLQSDEGLALAADRVLDLFDSEASVIAQNQALVEFLAGHDDATDILFYYVGHGGFLRDREYFLALRGTERGSEAFTSLRIRALAHTLEEYGHGRRKYLLLDCCFAGEAVREFQSGELSRIVETETFDALPERGTSLLVAASKDRPAIAPAGNARTMFSQCLLEVLAEGVDGKAEKLSLLDVGDATQRRIRAEFGLRAVRPEVHSPQQAQGDLARFPLFPNPAYRPPRPATGAGEVVVRDEGAGGGEAAEPTARPPATVPSDVESGPLPSTGEPPAPAGHTVAEEAVVEDAQGVRGGGRWPVRLLVGLGAAIALLLVVVLLAAVVGAIVDGWNEVDFGTVEPASSDLVVLDEPPFERYLAPGVEPSGSRPGLRLIRQSSRRNDVTDAAAWFQRHDLPPLFASTGAGAGPAGSGEIPTDVPRTYREEMLLEVYGGGELFLATYGQNYSRDRYLVGLAVDAERPRFAFDFTAYMRPPGVSGGIGVMSLTWAAVDQGILYVSLSHRGYARRSGGRNAFLAAIDVEEARLLWMSAPLVSNARNFLLHDGVLVSGYGFTDEEDYLYLLDRRDGEILQREAVRSAPDLIVEKGGRLLVRTYNTDHVFSLTE